MRLNSPTSTSKQIEVAIKFSGTSGVGFTLGNPNGYYDYQYKYLRGIHCSWLSKFMEEDEVLFFGGFYPIKVMNLRLIQTKQNFKKLVSAIFYFDLLLNGAWLKNIVA